MTAGRSAAYSTRLQECSHTAAGDSLPGEPSWTTMQVLDEDCDRDNRVTLQTAQPLR
jgi:hypothetical protein